MKSPQYKAKDLGIKVGTKEEVVWTNVKKEAKVLIEQSENNLIIQKALLKLANEKIETSKI